MNERTYEEIQYRLSKKLIQHPTNKEAEYNKGVLAAKSIVKEIYERQKELSK